MTYQVLYRKWRPKTFADVSGQPHIVAALQNEVREGRPAHAYLFIGSRGTGKTSCAKILAKAVNCLHPNGGDPCNECENCRGIDDGSILDVMEIDAASNNGVDSIRELREAVNFTPAVAKYRVYIIDEVHMLSDGAFNALLKTLEEPPPHVIFILATTEAHKMPATILSRCQRFDFARIAPEDIAARLQTVADGEGFTLTDEAAMLLARLADGAMRDALSLTDQCLSRSREIDADVVANATGLAGREHLYALSAAVREHRSGDALALIDKLYNASQDMTRLCTEWLGFYRELMLCKSVERPQDILIATDAELERLKAEAAQYELSAVLYAMDTLQQACQRLQTGADRRLETEMATLRLCNPTLDTSSAALLSRIEMLESAVKRLSAGMPAAPQPAATPPAVKQPAAEEAPVSEPPAPPVSAPAPTPAEPTADDAAAGERPFTAWRDVLERLRETCAPLFGVLENTEAVITDTHIIIYTDNPLFKVLLAGGTNKASLFNAIVDVTGKRYKLGVRAPQAPKAQDTAEDDPLLALLKAGEEGGVPVNRT
ncbi:MAG: DNA polymerase III subunit gamma/tau [Ruminococcaceae bacterium]|nr:DNA polymerase III subunit gamma/tau [Oscillospiraceae bacterium]